VRAFQGAFTTEDALKRGRGRRCVLNVCSSSTGRWSQARPRRRRGMLDVLRNVFGLTAQVWMQGGECGAWLGTAGWSLVNYCMGDRRHDARHEVTTIEGTREGPVTGRSTRLRKGRREVQCGFCTPGM
jgi:aerobic-type carbon monoxide dehydrogenase small subunit (CoxS/CutS family)